MAEVTIIWGKLDSESRREFAWEAHVGIAFLIKICYYGTMKRASIYFIGVLLILLSVYTVHAFEIPWSDILDPGTSWTANGWDLSTNIRSFAWRILGAVKIILSGIALIYLVILWVMIIVNGDNPWEVKKQIQQVVYTAIGFIFLNIPGILYQTIMGNGWASRGIVESSWKNTDMGNSVFFDIIYASDIRNGIINFLSILIFWVAILMFTWAILLILTSGTDDGRRKSGRERILWGALWLLSVAFLQAWIRILAVWNVVGTAGSIASVANRLLALAVFFAWPVVIFFLIFWAYYLITSAGDDGRAKKWKAIVINTFIATLLLIGVYTFLNDLMEFTL